MVGCYRLNTIEGVWGLMPPSIICYMNGLYHGARYQYFLLTCEKQVNNQQHTPRKQNYRATSPRASFLNELANKPEVRPNLKCIVLHFFKNLFMPFRILLLLCQALALVSSLGLGLGESGSELICNMLQDVGPRRQPPIIRKILEIFLK